MPPPSASVPQAVQVPPELVKHPRYRVLRLLGQGGMGAVYLAEHLVMHRRVALKTISPRFLDNPEAVGRFRREVRAAARLTHPNVVTAYDADQAGNLHFLVMEFVDGVSVAQYAARKGPLPVELACAIGSQVAQGLQHAHEQGLIHRDIKPQNLMLTPKGQVKILDFGLAQFVRPEDAGTNAALTVTGTVLGTADYIAPEQTSSSRSVDIRADIYSLGCTLYFLLSGRVPFPRGTIIDKFLQHATETPPPLASLRPGLPPPLVAVIEKMMAKQPDERFQTPAEVAHALRRFAGAARAPQAGPAPASVASEATAAPAKKDPVAKAVPGARRRRRLVLCGGLLALAVFAGLFLILLLGPRLFKGAGPGAGLATASGSSPGHAVSWAGNGPQHTIVDPSRSLKEILDYRDLTGATTQEFRDWQAGLGDGFRVSYVSNRYGLGPPLFNAVAVRQRTPVPARVLVDLSDEQAGEAGDKLKAEGLHLCYIGHCAFGEQGKYRHTMLWAGDHPQGYLWLGTQAQVMGKVEELRVKGNRPFALDVAAAGEGRLFTAFGIMEPAIKWEALQGLNRDDVLAAADKSRQEGRRPDVLAPYWDGERFVFLLVVRDNPEPIDWALRMDMTAQEYRKESARQKERGLFPLAVPSYGDEANVRYAAIWVRYRIAE